MALRRTNNVAGEVLHGIVPQAADGSGGAATAPQQAAGRRGLGGARPSWSTRVGQWLRSLGPARSTPVVAHVPEEAAGGMATTGETRPRRLQAKMPSEESADAEVMRMTSKSTISSRKLAFPRSSLDSSGRGTPTGIRDTPCSWASTNSQPLDALEIAELFARVGEEKRKWLEAELARLRADPEAPFLTDADDTEHRHHQKPWHSEAPASSSWESAGTAAASSQDALHPVDSERDGDDRARADIPRSAEVRARVPPRQRRQKVWHSEPASSSWECTGDDGRQTVGSEDARGTGSTGQQGGDSQQCTLPPKKSRVPAGGGGQTASSKEEEATRDAAGPGQNEGDGQQGTLPPLADTKEDGDGRQALFTFLVEFDQVEGGGEPSAAGAHGGGFGYWRRGGAWPGGPRGVGWVTPLAAGRGKPAAEGAAPPAAGREDRQC